MFNKYIENKKNYLQLIQLGGGLCVVCKKDTKQQCSSQKS